MVIATLSPETLKRALCDLMMIEPTDGGLEVVLPQIYSTGDVVSVIVRAEPDGFYIHDGGQAAMSLEGSGIAVTPRLQEHFRERLRGYQCEFHQARVSKRCDNIDKVAATAAIVGCASRLVADHVLQSEPSPLIDFRRQLVDQLYECFGSPRVRENEEIVAVTGSKYQVSAVLLDDARTKPIAYVEAIPNHQAVTRKFRTFYDLSKTPMISDTRRFAIYDAGKAGISMGDVALLRNVSEPWSYIDSEALWTTLR